MAQDAPVVRLAAATATGYLLLLVVGTLGLFVVPYLVAELG